MLARFERAKGGAKPAFVGLAIVMAIGLSGLAPAEASEAGAAGSSTWPMERYDAGQDGYNQAEHVLGRSLVPQLHLEGAVTLSPPLSDYTASPPVLSARVLYVAGYGLDQTSLVYAFSSTCGTSLSGCEPLWTADVGADSEPKVIVADGVVVVAGANDGGSARFAELYAFPARCRSDGGVCSPMWTARMSGYEPLNLAPTVSDGVVYLAGVDKTHGSRNYMFAFPLHCSTAGAICRPQWRGQMQLGDVYESAAVAHGLVFVPDYNGWVYGFNTSCGTDGKICDPVWSGYTGELGPSAAAVADGEVIVGSQNDSVYAFPVDCTLSCPPLWVGQTAGNVRSNAAIADGVVYLTSDDGNLYAFSTTCRGTCPALWTATLSGNGIDSFFGSPAVADGVVYVAWALNSPVEIAAFPAGPSCPGGCPPLWTGTAGNYELRGPTVAGAELWLSGGPSGGPGTVYAFGAS